MSWFVGWMRSRRIKLLVRQVVYEMSRMSPEECAFVLVRGVNFALWASADIAAQGDSRTATAVRTLVEPTNSLTVDQARELYFATEDILFHTQHKNRALLRNLENSPFVSVEEIKRGMLKYEAGMRLLLARLSQAIDRSNVGALKPVSTKLRAEAPSNIEGAVKEVHRLEGLADLAGTDGQSRGDCMDEEILKKTALEFVQNFSY